MKIRNKAILIIMSSFILIIAILLIHNHNERKVESQIKRVLGMIAITLDYDNPPLLFYISYGIKDDETITCKDYAWSFVVLYNDRFGDKAKLVCSNDHAFVKIGNTIIEPQQTALNYDKNFRIPTASYKVLYHYKVSERDKETIRMYFR